MLNCVICGVWVEQCMDTCCLRRHSYLFVAQCSEMSPEKHLHGSGKFLPNIRIPYVVCLGLRSIYTTVPLSSESPRIFLETKTYPQPIIRVMYLNLNSSFPLSSRAHLISCHNAMEYSRYLYWAQAQTNCCSLVWRILFLLLLSQLASINSRNLGMTN